MLTPIIPTVNQPKIQLAYSWFASPAAGAYFLKNQTFIHILENSMNRTSTLAIYLPTLNLLCRNLLIGSSINLLITKAAKTVTIITSNVLTLDAFLKTEIFENSFIIKK